MPDVDPAARRRIVALEKEMQSLRDELAALRQAMAWVPVGSMDGGGAAAGPAATDHSGAAQAPAGEPAGQAASTLPQTAGLAPIASGATEGEAASAPGPAAAPARTLEARIGSRWLAIAGITVSVAAVALFLRLAIQNGWIGPVGQILLIAALGLLVWALGIFLHHGRKLGAFPDVLAAGGVAITAFTAYATYGLRTYRETLGTTQEGAALLLAAVAVGALADALVRRKELQAMLVTVLVPFTAAFAMDWTTFSLAYVVVMTTAVLVAGAWRRWAGIPVLGVLGAYGVVLGHAFADVPQGIVLGAALVVLAAYNAVAVRLRDDSPGVAAAQALAWVGTWGVGVWAMQEWGHDAWWWTAILGAAAMAMSFVPATRSQRLAWRTVGFVGLIGFAAMLPWPRAIAAVWLVELAAAGAMRKWRPGIAAEAVTAVLSGLVGLRLLSSEAEVIDSRADGWMVALLLWGAASALFLALWAIERRRTGPQVALGEVHLGLAVAGGTLLAVLLLDGPAVSLLWAVLAVALIASGFAMKRFDLRVAGLVTFGLTLLRILFVDLAGVDAVWRVLAFAGIGVALLGTSWLYVRWERASRG